MYKLLEPSGYLKFKIVYLYIQTFGTIWFLNFKIVYIPTFWKPMYALIFGTLWSFKILDSLHSNLYETHICTTLFVTACHSKIKIACIATFGKPTTCNKELQRIYGANTFEPSENLYFHLGSRETYSIWVVGRQRKNLQETYIYI